MTALTMPSRRVVRSCPVSASTTRFVTEDTAPWLSTLTAATRACAAEEDPKVGGRCFKVYRRSSCLRPPWSTNLEEKSVLLPRLSSRRAECMMHSDRYVCQSTPFSALQAAQ